MFVLYLLITEDNVELLREMGGVAFVYNLSQSNIVHADVKEAALFTLGTLAEANGRYLKMKRSRSSTSLKLNLLHNRLFACLDNDP